MFLCQTDADSSQVDKTEGRGEVLCVARQTGSWTIQDQALTLQIGGRGTFRVKLSRYVVYEFENVAT